jgi:Mg2+/citrate symporter
MNPFAFFIAVAAIGFLFPLFQHMIVGCYMAGVKATDWRDRIFMWSLMVLFCFMFMSLVYGLLWLGTHPTGGPR